MEERFAENKDGRINGWKSGWMRKWMNKMDGWKYGWMDGRMERRWNVSGARQKGGQYLLEY